MPSNEEVVLNAIKTTAEQAVSSLTTAASFCHILGLDLDAERFRTVAQDVRFSIEQLPTLGK